MADESSTKRINKIDRKQALSLLSWFPNAMLYGRADDTENSVRYRAILSEIVNDNNDEIVRVLGELRKQDIREIHLLSSHGGWVSRVVGERLIYHGILKSQSNKITSIISSLLIIFTLFLPVTWVYIVIYGAPDWLRELPYLEFDMEKISFGAYTLSASYFITVLVGAVLLVWLCIYFFSRWLRFTKTGAKIKRTIDNFFQ